MDLQTFRFFTQALCIKIVKIVWSLSYLDDVFYFYYPLKIVELQRKPSFLNIGLITIVFFKMYSWFWKNKQHPTLRYLDWTQKRGLHRLSSPLRMAECSLSALPWLGPHQVSLNVSFLTEGFLGTLIVFSSWVTCGLWQSSRSVWSQSFWITGIEGPN